MRRLVACSALLVVGALLPGPRAVAAGEESALFEADRPVEFEACVEAFYSRDADQRMRAVRDLSGWALDGELREESLALLASARQDTELRVVLQAEVALASLTGGDPEAIRAAYGIVPPEARELAREALRARDPGERLRALTVLGRWHRGAETATLLAAARDPAPVVRLRALELLSEVADPNGAGEPVIGAFARATEDPDPAVRAFALSIVRSLP